MRKVWSQSSLSPKPLPYPKKIQILLLKRNQATQLTKGKTAKTTKQKIVSGNKLAAQQFILYIKRTRFEESNQICKRACKVRTGCDEEHDQVGVGISAMDASTGIDIQLSVFSNKATHGKAVVSELQTNVALVEAQKRISGRGLHASANCCIDSEKGDRESILQNHKEERFQIGSGKEILIKHAETTGVFLRYDTNSSSERRAHYGLKNKKPTHKKASTSINENNMSQVQDMSSV